MLALFGSGAAGVVSGVLAIVEWGSAAATYALLGAIASLVPIALTGAYHVPRNKRPRRARPPRAACRRPLGALRT
jgi:uncharacterized membrane protein